MTSTLLAPLVMERPPLVSNPWQNLMPGGVAFTPRPDEEDDWGFGAPGDPVGEADNPTDASTPAVEVAAQHVPVVEVPAQQAGVSTDVDTSVQAPASPQQAYTPEVPLDVPVVEVPAVETLPVEETPGWSAWGEWDDEREGDTPALADPLSSLLAPGQWATHTPEPATPTVEVPAQVPEVEVPPMATPVAEVPVVEVPAQHVPVVEVPAQHVPVVEAPTPAPGHPLPQPHPSVPPLHDPVLPATPVPAPVPTPVPAPAPVPTPAPVPHEATTHTSLPPAHPAVEAPVVQVPAVEGYVPEGYTVNPDTGELTVLPVIASPVATPAVEVPVVEVPAQQVPVAESPVADQPRTAPEGYWLNPFTMAIEPKPITPEQPTEHAAEQTAEHTVAVVEVPVPAPVVEPVPVVPYEFVDDETRTTTAERINTALADLAGQVNQDLTEDRPDVAQQGERGEGDSSAPLLAKVTSVEELLEAEEDFSDIEEAEAAAEAAAKAEKQRQSRATRPVAVTERDVAVLQFLARYRMATYPQLAAAFGISYTALRHRMPRLAREGLVVRKAIGKSTYSVWMPTDAGMKVADMDLTLPTLSWATVAHTLGLVDIGIRFEALGEVVVTEREIRAADTRDQPTDRMHQAAEMTGFTGEQARLYVVEMGDGTKQYAHIPDMVLARPPAENGGARSVAIELELNHKPSAQWRKILTAYLNAPHISQVIYFTHQSKVRSGILAAAKEVGAEHIVRVRKFEPSEDSAIPLPGK